MSEDKPRTDRIARNPMLCDLQSRRFGQAHKAVFRSHRRRLVDGSHKSVHTGDIYDSTPLLLDHIRQHSLCGVEGGGQVETNDLLPGSVGELGQPVGVLLAYVIHKDVDALEDLESPFDQLFRVFGVPEVGVDVFNSVILCLELGLQILDFVVRGEAVEDDVCSCCDKSLGDAQPDAPCGSSDQGCLPFEVDIHLNTLT